MTPLTEIIEGFHMKANTHYNPSMGGRRDARMEGRKEAYIDCANILEKWRKSIDEEKLEMLAISECNKILEPIDVNGYDYVSLGDAEDCYIAGYKKALEE